MPSYGLGRRLSSPGRLSNAIAFRYAEGRSERGTRLRRRYFIALAGVAALAGCETRLNPFNWFGRAQPSATIEPVQVQLDPRPLVPQVTQLEVEPDPAGAIVRATGLPPRQGWYDGRLIRVPNTEPGVLAYQFRAWAPSYQTLVSTPRSRELHVATFVSSDTLAGVREIRVSGQLNTLVSRR